MSSDTSEHLSDYICSQPRGFLTPPPWTTRSHSPVMPPYTERNPRRRRLVGGGDCYHILHKVPSGDSPYVRAKHTQLVDKDPNKAISLFWASINDGDRVDSALKDMAIVMKQLDRSDEAIEAIRSFRHLCSDESQESLDNILVELYKQSRRIEEEIKILRLKLKRIEEGVAFGGKSTKMARSQGRKIEITVGKEYSRLLGNLAWAYMQKKEFNLAEEHYRKSLSFESDKNRQCNLALCLMHMNKVQEAKFLLQAINVDESCAKSYDRAAQMLAELLPGNDLRPMNHIRSKMHRERDQRSPFSWNNDSPWAPFTQPRRFSRAFREGLNTEKLCFESSVNQNVEFHSRSKEGSDEEARGKENLSCNNNDNSVQKKKKSWAEMVEEEEDEQGNLINNTMGSEAIDSSDRPEESNEKMGSECSTQRRTGQWAKRSLCFDGYQTLSESHSRGTLKGRNRSKVFEDITN